MYSLFKPLDIILLRVPMLPVEKYLSLAQTSTPSPGADFDDERVLAAVAVASPSLLAEIERQSRSRHFSTAAAEGKLLRYIIRMSTRPTPYGLFSGVTMLKCGEKTDVCLDTSSCRTRTRADMEWLVRQVLILESDPQVRKNLHFIANGTILMAAGRAFLMEKEPCESDPGGKGVSIRLTGVVKHVLALSQRPVHYGDLASQLIANAPSASVGAVDSLLTELWKQTFLISSLRPSLLNPNPLRHVLDQIERIPAARGHYLRLKSLHDSLTEWEADPSSRSARSFKALRNRFEPKDDEAILQVDTAASVSPASSISTAIANEAAKAAEILLRVSPWPQGFQYLNMYRERFISRYGEREVKLLELLNSDFGLGSPYSPQSLNASGARLTTAKRDRILIRLASNALRNLTPSIELDSKMIEQLEAQDRDERFPMSVDVNVFVAARSPQAIDSGDFQIIVGPNTGASSAGKNLGRFATMLGADGQRALRDIDAAERALFPDVIFAELVYQPRKLRSANVAIRPMYRTHEIPVGIHPYEKSSHVIPLSELVVGVASNRFYLKWTVNDRKVIARSGHMLNSNNAPVICRFLEDISLDGLAHLSGFDWGAARDFPFLPRVQVGKCILRPAQWQIDAELVSSSLRSDSPEGFGESLASWRKSWRVPRHVYLSVGDNRLLLDLEDMGQVGELRRELRHLTDGTVKLQEAIPALDQVWLGGKAGHFFSEFTVFLTQRPAVVTREPAPEKSRAILGADIPRSLPPGSEWLYVKLYLGQKFEDQVISESVRPFCDNLVSAGLVAKWFFIRYSDPDGHLRLRFRGDPRRLTADVFPKVCSWANELMGRGICQKFSFDTYEQEVERYGGVAGLEIAESIFHEDSRTVSELLSAVKVKGFSLSQTALAVFTGGRLLDCLGFDQSNYAGWYEGQAQLRKHVSQDYRREKADLIELLTNPEKMLAERGALSVFTIMAQSRARYPALASRFQDLSRGGILTREFQDICGSLLHMHFNRLLGPGRDEERKIFGLLLRVRRDLMQMR